MIYVIYFSTSGVPTSGLTPTITTYRKVSDGTVVAPAPTITAIGSGGYKFSASPTEAIYVEIDGGITLAPFDRYKVLQITPSDDDMESILASVLAQGSGAGAIQFTYTLTRSDNGNPIADADVWITSDLAGTDILGSGRTDQDGEVVFYLDAGTVYVWRQKTGFNFTNPDIEVVS